MEHALGLFSMAFSRNLWISSIDDYITNPLFQKNDLSEIIKFLKTFILNILESENQTPLDRHALTQTSLLLRKMHELFTYDEFIAREIFEIPNVNWKRVIEKREFSNILR